MKFHIKIFIFSISLKDAAKSFANYANTYVSLL